MRMGDAIGSTGIISVKKYSHFVRLPSKTWLAFSYFVYIFIFMYIAFSIFESSTGDDTLLNHCEWDSLKFSSRQSTQYY